MPVELNRYYLRFTATIKRSISDCVEKFDFWVHNWSYEPEINNSIKMEVRVANAYMSARDFVLPHHNASTLSQMSRIEGPKESMGSISYFPAVEVKPILSFGRHTLGNVDANDMFCVSCVYGSRVNGALWPTSFTFCCFPALGRNRGLPSY